MVPGKRTSLILLIIMACGMSCNNGKPSAETTSETAPADTVTLIVDKPLESVIGQQQQAFQNMFTTPLIAPVYRQENDLLNALFKDSARCAILSRELTDAEIGRLTALHDLEPRQYTIAYDALALIVNSQYPADTITTTALKQILTSKQAGHTSFVFEHAASGSVSSLFRQLNLATEAGGNNTYAQKSPEKLAAYLRSNTNAIGCLPFSYISEIDAPYTQQYLKGLKVLAVSHPDSTGKWRSDEPTQENITTREYPLYKPIVLVVGNMKQQSGTVFVNFLLKSRAQRVFLKSGLVPVTFPGREVNINNKSINETEE